MTASTQIQTRIVSRPMQGVDDFARVRQFLLDTYRLTGKYHNWEIRRWEGQWYWGEISASLEWAAKVQLWETSEGQLVGVTHRESSGDAWLEIHPDYRFLEEDMLDWAEAHLAQPNQQGQHQLELDVYEYDTFRQEMLVRRGYEKTSWYGFLRWRSIDGSIPDVPVPEGYRIRSLKRGEWHDTARWAAVINQVFAHAKPTPNGIARFQSSPIYQHDLHLVAEAPDGTFAAFAGLTVEDVNRTAVFEPVGTHPDHRQKKLAQAVMAEGLRRLRLRGIQTVYVGTGDMIPANRLYESLGFTDFHQSFIWRKIF